jgi:hypothetical protein
VRLVLFRVAVVALPDVARKVAEDGGEVMVAAATRRGGLAELATADDAAEPLTLTHPIEGGAAPKRDAVLLFGHRT